MRPWRLAAYVGAILYGVVTIVMFCLNGVSVMFPVIGIIMMFTPIFVGLFAALGYILWTEVLISGWEWVRDKDD